MGIDRLNASDFFTMSISGKGHQYKIYKQRARLDVRKYTFSQRVVNVWNSLPNEAILESTINGFKGQMEKFLSPLQGSYMSQQVIGSLICQPKEEDDRDLDIEV